MQFNNTNLPNRHKNMDNLAEKKQEKDDLIIAASKFRAIAGRYPTMEIENMVKIMKEKCNDNRGERTSS